MPPDIEYKQTSLYSHYGEYSPKTLYDIYGTCNRLKKYPYHCLFLPWIHRKPVVAFRDDAFICSDKKAIKRQVKKIKTLITSIRENGYRPEKFLDRKGGNITGYFLKEGQNQKFYVVSGNHRTSVLLALEPKYKIPTVLEKEKFMKPRDRENRGLFRTTYELEHADQWPSVLSGFIEVDDARKIAYRFMEQ